VAWEVHRSSCLSFSEGFSLVPPLRVFQMDSERRRGKVRRLRFPLFFEEFLVIPYSLSSSGSHRCFFCKVRSPLLFPSPLLLSLSFLFFFDVLTLSWDLPVWKLFVLLSCNNLSGFIFLPLFLLVDVLQGHPRQSGADSISTPSILSFFLCTGHSIGSPPLGFFSTLFPTSPLAALLGEFASGAVSKFSPTKFPLFPAHLVFFFFDPLFFLKVLLLEF